MITPLMMLPVPPMTSRWACWSNTFQPLKAGSTSPGNGGISDDYQYGKFSPTVHGIHRGVQRRLPGDPDLVCAGGHDGAGQHPDYGLQVSPGFSHGSGTVSYTHLRAHETDSYLVCRLLLE